MPTFPQKPLSHVFTNGGSRLEIDGKRKYEELYLIQVYKEDAGSFFDHPLNLRVRNARGELQRDQPLLDFADRRRPHLYVLNLNVVGSNFGKLYVSIEDPENTNREFRVRLDYWLRFCGELNHMNRTFAKRKKTA